MLTQEDKEKIKSSIYNHIEMQHNNICELEKNFITELNNETSSTNDFDKTAVPNALRILKGELARLIHSLNMVDKPNFGLCTRCGNQIPFNQLINSPEESKCPQCK